MSSISHSFSYRLIQFGGYFALASGLVFSVTYFGNIWNAISGAQRLNRNRAAPIEAELKKSLFPELVP